MTGLKDAVAEMKRLCWKRVANGNIRFRHGYCGDPRIEAVIARSGERLARRVLSITNGQSGKRTTSRCVFWRSVCCERSGGKSVWHRDPQWSGVNQFEVFNDELGKPRLRLWGRH